MQTASKKVTTGWAMYDWANSVYNLVITTTFFPIYFESVTKTVTATETIDKVEFLGRTFVNSSLYSYCLAVAYLVIALSYPILTSMADTRGSKKNFMRFFCYMGALGCCSLYFFKSKEQLGFGIASFIMAAMGYAGSLVFYNSYLPEIAAPQDRDRISAKGFSYGYVGSVLMQIVGFALVTLMDDKGEATRITFLLVGLWWIGFAQITFARLPKIIRRDAERTNVFKNGFAAVKKVYGEINNLPVLKRFLRGFFFYSMGVQTVMVAASLFGSKLLALPAEKLIITIVLIQLVAAPGAIFMSRLSAKKGNIPVLMLVVFFWILICIAAFLTAQFKENGGNPEYGFYGLAIAVGIVMGGIQSLSRSTYSKLIPETTNTASYFSYYDLTEKIAIVIGILVYGFVDEKLGMKYSVLSLTVFFVIGLIWLYAALQKQKSVNTPVTVLKPI